MDTLVQITGATASYGNRQVLREVDLTLFRGQIVGLIGINGAGKSTLVSTLVGRHQLESGIMILDDEPYAPTSLEEAQACGVGVIAQNAEPPNGLTVAQALFRNTYRAGEAHEAVLERAQELLELTGAELDLEAMVNELDRGRRALVEVVRMLAEEAQLVVIDEVAVTLADHEIALLHRVLRQLAAQGRGILYITHRMDEVQSIVDRVLVLREGKIAIDTPISGLSSEELTIMLIGELPEADATLAIAADDAHRAALAAFGVGDGDHLHGVDLHVRPGEVVGITGTHDSGVRQLIEILGGAQRPREGHVELFGEPIDLAEEGAAESHGVSFLPDAVPSFDADRSLIQGVDKSDSSLSAEISRARKMIDLVHRLRINTTNINAALDELSGGDQQKAEFIRAVERGGNVLVLAHPTQGVDVGARRSVFAFLHSLAETGTSVVFLGTDMTELLQWSHRVVVIANGRTALEGRSDLLDEDMIVHAMLGAQRPERLGRRAAITP
ncbi:ATP-binding cassette domain-containing protein [Pseudoclavibacter sp. RFBA6]|uniref:ATP-binding cassette domain-containing protein n=1 Tax=Pseudoclavibacter sp. RFBA6 TaxID=2080573 RepID=UPI000CE84498|nr:ATP-binding cassette domain-containing protein [Pseudoclavibacter sp. RFBA6]PPG39591.1 sugar ABC transporter ATP-binding protein [Pseudoclavibacter sp. RFBA6]